jgi:hypothetical protein
MDLILEAGHVYDSSVLRNSRDVYDIRKGLLEIPPNSIDLMKFHIPSGGGFFFRLIPFFIYRQYVNYLIHRGYTLNFYIHSWELFTDYPRIEMGFIKKFVQYANMDTASQKYLSLTKEFKFSTISNYLKKN